MSELKLIVDQAVEEMGGWNDAAIDRWSELSGVDVRAINDTTPFDIDVANRLLATFPQVLKEMMAGPAPLPPEEPTPEEVITELSEMAEGISEALDMTPEETKALEVTIPEVDLEPGLTEGAPPVPDEVPVKEEPAIPESSSIEALIRELESLARGVEPTLKEEVSSEAAEEPPVLAETPAESVAPTEPPATETPVSDEGIITEIAEEILAETPEEVSASLETPSGEMPAPDEVPSAASWEVPAPVAEELEKAARIMEEMEVSEYNLSAIEKAVPGFQAACVVRDGKVVARHSKRDVDWTALSQVVAAANGVFRVSLGIGEHSIDELVMGLGNLFILGFPVREAQVIVIVKSDKIGAARAYVSAALKNI
ncbi:MAG: hypothetical protein ACPL68_00620 [Candidatus Hydrothermia bacterium]